MTLRTSENEKDDNMSPGSDEKLFNLEQQLEELKSQISKGDFSSISREITRGITDANEVTKGGRMYHRAPVDVSEIDPGDYLDIPKTFFKYAYCHTILDDYRSGRTVRTPFGTPIKFKNIVYFQTKGQSRFDKTVIAMCIAVIYSKKEYEWLKNHTRFGIDFFEDIKKAQDTDAMYAQKLADLSSQLSGMSQMAIINRCKNEGIDFSSDVQQMKRDLIIKLAKKTTDPRPTKPLKMMTAEEMLDKNISTDFVPDPILD